MAQVEGVALQNWLQLRPTAEQYDTFGEYVAWAHSWYKHLPLMSGRRFVMFLAPDAGIGRLVAVLHGDKPESATGYSLMTPSEGSEFTEAHPRLHYGWKTTREYRSRFGHLDYSCWQDSPSVYNRDAGPPIRLPASIEDRCGFVLYPYVSETFAQAVNWEVRAEALAELRSGAAHPARDEILDLARQADVLSSAWDTLGDVDRNWVISRRIEEEKPGPEEPSVELRRYLELDDRVNATAKSLRNREADKIRRALAELDDWLLQSQTQ